MKSKSAHDKIITDCTEHCLLAINIYILFFIISLYWKKHTMLVTRYLYEAQRCILLTVLANNNNLYYIH